MGDVISIVRGRQRLRKALPKPKPCKDCGEPIETARLQVAPYSVRCIDCAKGVERRHNRALATARDQDIVIIRR